MPGYTPARDIIQVKCEYFNVRFKLGSSAKSLKSMCCTISILLGSRSGGRCAEVVGVIYSVIRSPSSLANSVRTYHDGSIAVAVEEGLRTALYRPLVREHSVHVQKRFKGGLARPLGGQLVSKASMEIT